MPSSYQEFVDRLNKSGLISENDLLSIEESLSPERKKKQDALALSLELIRLKKITPYQAEVLSGGSVGPLVLGNYILLDKLGEGGMGQVFKAEHRRMERVVAVKVLTGDLTKDDKSLHRFQREVKAVAKLSHPNIVTAHDADEAGGVHFLVMEYVEGRDLSYVVKKNGPLTVRQALNVTLQAAQALEYAHSNGIFHRDIKPSNLLVDSKGTLKLLDLGLARVEATGYLGLGSLAVDQQTQSELTGAGAVMGTIAYMAPEQAINAKNADQRSDIYSLGCTMYFLLTGKPPYTGQSPMEVLVNHRDAPIPSLSAAVADAPADLDTVFRTMLAKKPVERYQSVSDLIAALHGLQIEDRAPVGAGMPLPAAGLLGSGSDSGSRVKLPSDSGRGVATAVAAEVGSKPSDTEAGRSLQTTQPDRIARPAAPVPTRKRLVPIAAAAAAVIALVAGGLYFSGILPRGGSADRTPGSDGTGGGKSATTPAVASAANPIRVGVLHSRTGTMAISERAVIDATLLAIDKLNEKGGVLGRRVEPIVEDGASDWPTFADRARKLITQDKVCTIFGCWTSASRKTVRPVFEEYDHLLFYPVQYEGLEQSPNIVYTGAAPNQQIIPAIKWCVAFLNKKRLFLVGSDYVFPRSANAIVKDEAAALGAQIVGEEYVLLGSSDVAEIVRKIMEVQPDAIINTINGDFVAFSVCSAWPASRRT